MPCDLNVRLCCGSHWLPSPVLHTLILRPRTLKEWIRGRTRGYLDSVAAGRYLIPSFYGSCSRKRSPRRMAGLPSDACLWVCRLLSLSHFPYLTSSLSMPPVTNPDAVRVNRRSRALRRLSSPPPRLRPHCFSGTDPSRSLGRRAEDSVTSHI